MSPARCEIFGLDLEGGSLVRLTDNESYDAEGAVSPDGRRIVLTLRRESDLTRIRPV